MKVKDIKNGDIVTYKCGRVNYVNKPNHYQMYYTNNFKNKEFSSSMDIVKIQRYVRYFWFYRLKTIYERGKK